MFSKILIANPSEIACRVIRSAKKVGLRIAGDEFSVEAEVGDPV